MLRNLACLKPTARNLYYPPERGDYEYFEIPRLSNGDAVLEDAAWAADASMLAYARYGSTRMPEAEFTSILRSAGFPTINTFGDYFADKVSTARAFFAANEGRAVLAFRGTEKDDIHDVTADTDLLPMEDRVLGVRVHRGFNRYLHSIWPQIAEQVEIYRRDHPSQEICITGHSLGGALATLAFAYLRDPATSLFTFGCPRVGDQEFCNRVIAESRTRRCYRVVDNLDVVTHIPFRLGYKHPTMTVMWLDRKGRLHNNPLAGPTDGADFRTLLSWFFNRHLPWLFSKRLPRPVADHSPVRYCHWIGQELRRANDLQSVR